MGGNWDLCKTLREIADVIGREQALRLAGQVIQWERRGKSQGKQGSFYVPRCRVEGSLLSELVPPNQDAKLVAAFGGEALTISAPMGMVRRLRDACIIGLAGMGRPMRTIGFLCDVSERQVRNIVNLHGAAPHT